MGHPNQSMAPVFREQFRELRGAEGGSPNRVKFGKTAGFRQSHFSGFLKKKNE
jgi:hypothetical protein